MKPRGSGELQTIRVLGLALILVFLLLFVEMMRGGPLWRASYPHLPRQAQAIPYRIRARLPGTHPTPVALPTPAPAMEGGGSIDPIQPLSPKSPISPGSTEAREVDISGEGANRSTAEPAGTSAFALTLTPTLTPIANPSPSATRFPLPASAALTGLRHEYQTWNNCGPATMSMALGLVGDDLDQAVAARFLKPDPDDKNVSPDEMARFAVERGYGAVSRPGGDLDLMRHLISMDIPVVVETWFVPDPGDEMGHYRVLTGFETDAASGALVFQAADSYLGPGIEISATQFDEDWRAFNRRFIVVYPLEREPEVEAALGERWVEAAALAHTAALSMAELEREQDVWAWYNLGASLLEMNDPIAAAQAFDRARAIGLPWRLLWYRFEAFEAYAEVERWSDIRALAEANLRNAPNLEESHYWLGRALEAEGDEEAAKKAYRRALDLHPAFEPAKARIEGR
jgi:hypothetical protein